MDKFIVSARKYRPQNFSTVIGQSHITTTLKNAIRNNQLAHAFLFCGPRGVGKTTCARILAKTINCEHQTADGEACNTCSSCVSFDAGTSMNIHELDAASNNSVDDIRSLVEQVRFAPQAGKFKVYIVDEVHMLSSSAFNAFLKTLEEPPPYAIFILATTEKHKIIPTILSRCQIFDFKRITNNDTIEHLQEICEKEKIRADKAALHVIAQKSEGCMRDALSILDKIVSFTNGELNYANTLEHLNILDEDYYFRLIGHMQHQQLSDALLLYDEINQKGFEGDTLLEGFAEFIRNLMVSKDAKAVSLLEVADDFRQKYLEVAQSIPTGWMIAALNVLNDSAINYKQARNKRLHVELSLIKLSYLGQALELVSQEGVLSKKKLTDTAKPVAFRQIPLIRIKAAESNTPSKTSGAKLLIEKAESVSSQRTTEQIAPVLKDGLPAEKRPAVSEPVKSSASISSLEKIRRQVSDLQKKEGTVATPLTEDELYVAWGSYIEKLVQRKNHSAVTNFRMAVLKVKDPQSIEIITDNNIQQKFIEQERASLVDHLQTHFGNKQLTYTVLVIEKEPSGEPVEKPLSAREQYLKLIEEYPLVKELKDRLRLELDY
ncbi:MAG: DNA polymerase III subunit gamma/tau [Chitinophagaceae bacterium]|nr:DNA polymerase III subunit gamma/tau [Chitinophagaceae bacterium]MBL0055802.1 DNA polymerase III subunit gamma/tau [Chitinophagaceae bacterium]